MATSNRATTKQTYQREKSTNVTVNSSSAKIAAYKTERINTINNISNYNVQINPKVDIHDVTHRNKP